MLQEKVDEGELTLVKIHIDDNGADMPTKNLPVDKLRFFQQKTRLTDSLPHE